MIALTVFSSISKAVLPCLFFMFGSAPNLIIYRIQSLNLTCCFGLAIFTASWRGVFRLSSSLSLTGAPLSSKILNISAVLFLSIAANRIFLLLLATLLIYVNLKIREPDRDPTSFWDKIQPDCCLLTQLHKIKHFFSVYLAAIIKLFHPNITYELLRGILFSRPSLMRSFFLHYLECTSHICEIRICSFTTLSS